MNNFIDDNICQSLSRTNFLYFLKQAFPIINPGIKYLANWHIAVIADHLERVSRGEIKRLIINVPPRSLKSFCTSIAWPAWLLGQNPSQRIIVASYSHHLSYKHALDCRHLIKSKFYQQLFPRFTISKDQNQRNKFITSKRGFRFATSIGGATTGEGGDILIIDDPHNALHIHSVTKRKNVQRWFQQSFSTRLDDKKNGAIVIVMQRLHHEDLTGFLLETQNGIWQQLIIPAIASEDQIYYEGANIHYFKTGDLLHQTRESNIEIERAKLELGSYAFAAQYLQQPIVSGVGMIKPEWLNHFDETQLPKFLSIVLSWDTAIKTGENNSFSVCTCWGETQSSFYLLEVIRKRLEYPELKREIIFAAEKWNPLVTLIEDKASGQTLIQDLQRETNLPIIAMKVIKDKTTRFARITPLFEAGRVLIAKTAPWRVDYETEILSFPGSVHSDQADSTSQYFNYIFNRRATRPRLRSLL